MTHHPRLPRMDAGETFAELAPDGSSGLDLPQRGQLAARAAIAAQLAGGTMRIVPPGPRDLVVLLRGMPVAPWVPLRAATDVWATWLAQLERLWAQWQENANTALAGIVADIESAAVPWDTWRDDHVVWLQSRRVGTGMRLLARVLEGQTTPWQAVHLIGHSVGGATVLAYLAALRARQLPSPPLRLRTVITLDAAVTGVAGIWSGARRSLADTASKRLNGLGAWAAQQGVSLVTATNEWDVWSHRQLCDLPYVAVRPTYPRHLLRQLDGTIHGWLRRTPHLVEALWGTPPQKTLATSRSQGERLLGQDSNL